MSSPGELDLGESELAREAWRSLKAGRIGLSFGYLTKRARDRKGRGRDLLQVDLFEVSLTAAPVNDGTRILDYKSESSYDFATSPKSVKSRQEPTKIATFDA